MYSIKNSTTLSAYEIEQRFGPIPCDDFGNYSDLYVEYRNRDALDLLNQLPTRGLGVVGTRTPTLKSSLHMESVFTSLKDSKLVIISGLARGIDSKAHSLAIESGLKTIAVLGCGLDISYPAANAYLRKDILDSGGLIITDYPLNTPPKPAYFLRRNRWISFFSQALWVVEAPGQSGSLNTAAWASKLSRHIFSTPCSPGDPHMGGNEYLLSNHVADPIYKAHSLWPAWVEFKTIDPYTLTSLKQSVDKIKSLDHKTKLFITTCMDLTQEQGLFSHQSLLSRLIKNINQDEIQSYLVQFISCEWIDTPKSGLYRFKVWNKQGFKTDLV